MIRPEAFAALSALDKALEHMAPQPSGPWLKRAVPIASFDGMRAYEETGGAITIVTEETDDQPAQSVTLSQEQFQALHASDWTPEWRRA